MVRVWGRPPDSVVSGEFVLGSFEHGYPLGFVVFECVVGFVWYFLFARVLDGGAWVFCRSVIPWAPGGGWSGQAGSVEGKGIIGERLL